MFFARDIRGGLGERRVFKVILGWLAENEPNTVLKNIKHVAEYGRFDDLLCLMGTPCERRMLDVLKAQFDGGFTFTNGATGASVKWNADGSVNKMAEKFVVKAADSAN